MVKPTWAPWSNLGPRGGYAAEASGRGLVTGCRDFEGYRLNILQIGLGTCRTFLQNLTDPSNSHQSVSWLLTAATDRSWRLRGVGVEPVPEHVEHLQPALESLPYTSLLQGAVSTCSEDVEVFAVTPQMYENAASKVPWALRDSFDNLVIYLRNMSCVGQKHPDLDRCYKQLEAMIGVGVEMEPIRARAFSYSEMSSMLNFNGVEVLIVDAEGHDCRILQSMIDHCNSHESTPQDWPDVIQFETMGHCDRVDGSGVEDRTVRSLQFHGYASALVGRDTVMVKLAALPEQRMQDLMTSLKCESCGIIGQAGMPYASWTKTRCRSCEWPWVPPDERSRPSGGGGAGAGAWDDWGQDCWATWSRWEGSDWGSSKDRTQRSKWAPARPRAAYKCKRRRDQWQGAPPRQQDA